MARQSYGAGVSLVADAALVGAAVATGLLGGVLLAFSSAADRGLARLGDRAYVTGMQAVNVAILNPAFLAVFLGSPVLLVLAAALDRSAPAIAAAVVGVVGGTGVTAAVNVPLNDRLAVFAADGADDAAVAAARAAYEVPWQRANRVRVLACAVATGLVVVAALD